MTIDVRCFDDAGAVLDEAAEFLASEPIAHNLIATLLGAGRPAALPGRYWVAADDGEVIGITFQSPLHFVATVTPLTDPVRGCHRGQRSWTRALLFPV